MKITVYTLATDDDCGTNCAVFGTERERDDALLEWCGSSREEFEESGTDAVELHEFVQARTDYLDTFSTDEHEIEVPAPTMKETVVSLLGRGYLA